MAVATVSLRTGSTEMETEKSVVEIKAFTQAYEEMTQKSILISTLDRGKVEVWETAHNLLTVVDFKKKEFFTLERYMDPAKYNKARQDFLADKILNARQQIFSMTPREEFAKQKLEKGALAYALALVKNHPSYYQTWVNEKMAWAERAAGETCLMENCGRALYVATDDPLRFACPLCGSTYSCYGFLEFVQARRSVSERALKQNKDEIDQVKKDIQALVVRLQQLKIEKKILAKNARDWGVR
jgi:hypothetical protein